ncbi:MAG: dihydroorotate dehydrogenase electron transfer subunit, partial [Desulfobulbaceae bacterium]|nr:dihydroorotate dehydrogenase electron transfer subunit [Desulfobulbaceae bacterium]
MSEYQEKASVVAIDLLAPDVFRLTLHAPLIAGAAHPGQFVMVRVGLLLDPLLRRPFSIHQVAATGDIQLLFKVVGRGTFELSELRVGRTVDLIGPLGRGFPIHKKESVCLVGGGMGIAPLYF